jgi:uncharacterized protein (DUF2267 family)
VINKKALTKKVWYRDELWTVERVISPNKCQDFLLLSIKPGETTEDDGFDTVYMAVIDVANDVVHPNTKDVRQIMKKRAAANMVLKESKELTDAWLELACCE